MHVRSSLRIPLMVATMLLPIPALAQATENGCILPGMLPAHPVGDVQAIGNALEEWKLAWGRDRARSQFASLANLYVGGDAIRSLALENGFKGWQVTWMSIDRIAVAGEHAASTSTILRGGDGGYRVMHIWRKQEGRWQILHEQLVSPSQVMSVETQGAR